MKKNKKILLTLSGGADSATLLYMAAKQSDVIYAVCFDYGQRHKNEMYSADLLVNDFKKDFKNKTIVYKQINIDFLVDLATSSSITNQNIDTPDVNDIKGEAQPVTYVPFRNMIFLSVLCSYAESNNIDEVWYGAAQVDSLAGYWDSSDEFVEQINNLTKLNRMKKITIKAPLIDKSKQEIIKLGADLGVRFEHTYTCYSGEYPCDMNTASSNLRLKGFIDCKLVDPLLYKQQDRLNEIYLEQNCKLIKQSQYPKHIINGIGD